MVRLLALVLFLVGNLVYAQADSPVGRWKTVDDDSGEVQSIIEIYPDGKKYAGKIVQILTGNDDARCTECSGANKGKPILGLVIIEDLVADTDAPSVWEDGTILDPRKGSSYRLSAWYEDGNTNKLYIRGKHWTGLYRTQTWIRE